MRTGFSLLQVVAYSSGVAAFRSSQRDSTATLIDSLQIQRFGDSIFHPANGNGNCVVGSGHSVSGGCLHAPAFEAVYPCPDDSGTSTCIQDNDTDFGGTGYNRFTKTTNEWNALTKVVVDAEFAGYGAAVSLGVDALKYGQSTDDSIGFFCGSKLRLRSREILNPVGMKMTASSKWMLSYSPKFFAQQFGTEYVYKMEYGGSFLGSFIVHSRTKESQSSLDVFADIAVEQPVFDADLGLAFNQAKKKVASNITIDASFSSSGGTDLKSNLTDPGTLGAMFDHWQLIVRASPVPVGVNTRKWSDSADFNKVLLTLDPALAAEARSLLLAPKASPQWRSMLGQEIVKLSFVTATMEREIRLLDGSSESDLKKKCLRAIRNKVLRGTMRIQQLDDITAVEEEIAFNNPNVETDIIQSDVLLDEVRAC